MVISTAVGSDLLRLSQLEAHSAPSGIADITPPRLPMAPILRPTAQPHGLVTSTRDSPGIRLQLTRPETRIRVRLSRSARLVLQGGLQMRRALRVFGMATVAALVLAGSAMSQE